MVEGRDNGSAEQEKSEQEWMKLRKVGAHE